MSSILNPDQINELLSIIERQNIVMFSNKFGKDFLNQEQQLMLNAMGVDLENQYDATKDVAKMSFHLGMLSEVIKDTDLENLNFEHLKEYISSGKNIPLNKEQQFALKSIKNQYLGDIKANGNRIFSDINNVLVNAEKENRDAYEKIIRDEIEQGFLDKKTVSEIARDLARMTGDWNRNFRRMVDFIMHTAYSEGRAEYLRMEYGDDVLVWVRVFNGACKICNKLYKKPRTGEPKLFKLSELRANGNNIGFKQKDWKEVVPPMHPHCRCLLERYDGKYKWNKKTKDFTDENENWKPQRTIDRPKATITIGDVTYKV